jgi:AraC-like DNA-binding protein
MLRTHAIEAELQQFRQACPPPLCGASWQVRKLLDALHVSVFDAAVNVQTLKDRCRIRDNNVSSLFKHEMGTSMKAYQEALRLEAACRLLEHGSFTAAEVARAVGYSNLQTFYRAFERRYGLTPGMLRRGETRKVA